MYVYDNNDEYVTHLTETDPPPFTTAVYLWYKKLTD